MCFLPTFYSSRPPDWISWLDLQQNHCKVHYFLNHSGYISKPVLSVYKTCELLFQPSCLTHVCRPVKSTAVLLVKGINVGPLRQQQIGHLSSKGTGETKKFRNRKMVGKKEWLCQSQPVGYRLWVSRASVGVCLPLYNILLNTIQDDSSTETNAWSQFRKWAWKWVCGSGTLQMMWRQFCASQPTAVLMRSLVWTKWTKSTGDVHLLDWGMWDLSFTRLPTAPILQIVIHTGEP